MSSPVSGSRSCGSCTAVSGVRIAMLDGPPPSPDAGRDGTGDRNRAVVHTTGSCVVPKYRWARTRVPQPVSGPGSGRPPSCTPNVMEPTRTTPPTDPTDRRIRVSWWFLAGAFALLGLVLVARLVMDPIRPIDLVLAGLVALVGYAALQHRNAVHALDEERRGEAESFARILQGLSRSVSPDAIVDAIVEELGVGTGADHIVVVRRRAGATTLEATLVSTRPGLRGSSTQFPLSDLEDPLGLDEAYREPVAIAVGAEQLALALLGRGGGVLEPSATAVAPAPLAPVPMAEL